jgi:type VI secretion system protein ImpG
MSPGGFNLQEDKLVQETLSLNITCSNGNLPRDLPPKAITQPAPDFTNVTSFENLTQPTLVLQPPHLEAMRAVERQDKLAFLWKLISHLALNSVSVASLEGLRSLLELYDWTSDGANRTRIEGLRSATWSPKETLYRGALMRGVEVTVEVELDHFAGEGDLCLFGLVLSEFFNMYATINSFVHTTIIAKPTEQRYHWQPQRGKLPII